MNNIVTAYRALRAPECKHERENVLAGLVSAGWLEPEPPKYKAAGVRTWHVNPKVHELFKEQADAEKERRAAIVDDIKRAAEGRR